MYTFAVVCFLLGCSVVAQALYVKQKRPIKQVYCYDYTGRPVYPGQSYYDGCNTCTWGPYGRPTICTRRYCGGKIIDTIRPIYPVKPVKPVYPIRPVKPVKPVKPIYPVNPVKPVYPIRPVKSVQPVYPVNPVKPVYPIRPVKTVQPVYPATY